MTKYDPKTDLHCRRAAAAGVAFQELVRTVETLPPTGATVLSMDHSGVVRLDGKKVKVSDVSSHLQRLFRRRSDLTVYVHANGALSFVMVETVIDAAKAAGASRIALIASRE
jgi:biopolymer transport protein ExbD